MTEKEQVEEMAKMIRPILENRTGICFIPDLDKPIAEELLKRYQPKLPKDSVVLSKEEWKQIKNSLYYSKEELERKLQKESKETAKEICDLILEYWEKKQFVECDWLRVAIAEKYGVEV